MDIGRSPIIAPVPTTDTKVVGRGAQATELPQFQTVQQATKSDSTTLTFREVVVRDKNSERSKQAEETKQANDEARSEQRARETRRDFEVDRETSALIFRSIDVSTGEVVQQYPEEARLNLRVYLAEQEAEQADQQSSSSNRA